VLGERGGPLADIQPARTGGKLGDVRGAFFRSSPPYSYYCEACLTPSERVSGTC
jgi:hypothetical protein